MKGVGIARKAAIALTASLLLASAFLGFKLLFPSGDGYRNAALDNGQRIEFSLLTGEVSGKAMTLEEAKASAAPMPPTPTTTEEKPQEPATPTAPDVAEQAPPAEPVTPSATSPAPTPSSAVEAAPAPALPAPVPPLEPVEQQLASGQIVPVIQGNQTPMTHFAKKDFTVPPRTVSQIAIAVSGLGQSERLTEAAVALPPEVTLSFSPYGKLTRDWAQAARGAGHELLLDLPMQTHRYPAVDPGPYGLLVEQTPEEADTRFLATLASARGYIGLLTPYDDVLSQNETGIAATVARLHARGLMMLNTYAQPTEAMFQLSQRSGVPILHAQILIDRKPDETSIKNQLARAEDISKQYEKLLIVTQASPLALRLLDEWLASLPQKRIAIVPVSSLLPPPPPQAAPPAPPAAGSDAAAAEETLKQQEKAAPPIPATAPAPKP